MCSICPDWKRFQMKLNDAIKIRTSLERMMPNTTVDTSVTNGKELRTLFSENYYAHFMCGYCNKANINQLSMEESKITELIIKFLAYSHTNYSKMPEKIDGMYYQVLKNLRGNYPKIAHNLEQYWFSRVKNHTTK